MLSPKYNPSYTKGTLEPTLPDPPRAPLCLPSFRNFFSLFTPSLPGNITVPNTPSTHFTASSSALTPTALNHRIYREIACLNRRERRKE